MMYDHYRCACIDVVPMAPAADQFWANDLVSSDVMVRDLEEVVLYSFINKRTDEY